MPIAEARALAKGTQVTVEGYVTVAPGTFVSAMNNEGFAIQDATGGIYVKLAQKLDFGVGTRVRVTGTLKDEAQLRILESEPASVEKLSGTQKIESRDVTTGGINESTEGLLVRASGNVTRIFEDDSPYGYKLYFNDGSGEVQIFVHVSAGFEPDRLRAITAGQHLQVTGFSTQYKTTYELAPRQPSDLVVQ
ncbi:DNA-binding protein [Archangium primigenium]|nr:DNA-binding protein [Archangium primigenium]